jgi:uncharacterized protein YigE (DUF2233 family)
MNELNVAARLPHIVSLYFISMSLAPGSLFAAECAPFEFQNISATVCRIDTREERLRLFHTDEKGRPLKYFSGVNRLLKASNERLVFGMNAGMYHSDFSAVGLLVMDGEQVQPLNLETADGNFFLKPNGVFLVSDQGARVIESSRYPSLSENVSIATQSGPMLVLDGALHPAFREDSTSRNIRNGVGILSQHEVVFAISEQPVTFYEFAVLFRNGLGCKDALFLDATVSSLYSENLERADVRASLGPIIGVTRRVMGDR